VSEAALLELDALDAVDAEIVALIDQAIADARAASPPDAAQLLTDVYVSY
jgi:pyruvate dehydrogenase E1 component alpha subunit